MGKIVIAGGGMCGMAAAMMLADDGHEVTVLERDPSPPPPDPDSAFDGWDRRSVAQFGLAHFLLARGTSILESQLPSAYQLLSDHGGFHLNLVEFLLSLQPDAVSEPDDQRFGLLTGRRSTLEWALATAAGNHPGVTLRRGDAIAGLTTGPIGDRRGSPRDRVAAPLRRGAARRHRDRRHRAPFSDARLARRDRSGGPDRGSRGQRVRLLRALLQIRRWVGPADDGSGAGTVRNVLGAHASGRQRHLVGHLVRLVRGQTTATIPGSRCARARRACLSAASPLARWRADQ